MYIAYTEYIAYEMTKTSSQKMFGSKTLLIIHSKKKVLKSCSICLNSGTIISDFKHNFDEEKGQIGALQTLILW